MKRTGELCHGLRLLSRLLVDVDEYVSALERGTANSVAPQVASKDAELQQEVHADDEEVSADQSLRGQCALVSLGTR